MQKPRQYKALILDLDGTCVKIGLQNLPSAPVIAAVRRLVASGVPVAIATGRNVEESLEPIRLMGIVEPCMTSNGAVIYDPVKKEILEIVPIEQKELQQIYEIAKKDVDKFVATTAMEEFGYDEKRFQDDLITAIFIDKLTKEQAYAYAKEMKQISTLSVHASNAGFDGVSYFVSINNARATKQRALQHLLHRLEINAEDIVACGDGDNDLPMVVAAGMGVAMGNAVDDLKAVADYIAPTVDEDGVAHVIDKFFPSS